MSFLNPTYLWGLLGLAIPIAIHLWSKKEGKTIQIGSIKLLSDEDSKQSSSISLNELLLLFLRLFIITLLVLVMAEPQIKKETINSPIIYIIEPSLVNNKSVASLVDSLKMEASVKFLKEGFPEFNDDVFERSDFRTPNYWQLAKEMESLHTDSIVVFTNAFKSGIKGKRPIVAKNIEWLIFDTVKPQDIVIEATQKKEAIQLLSLLSDDKNLLFKKEHVSGNKISKNVSKDSIKATTNKQQKWIALSTEDTINILLFYDKQFTNQSIYIEAGLNAISKHLEQPIKLQKTQDSSNLDISVYNKIVWLSKSAIPSSNAGVLLYKKDNLANALITESESLNKHYLTQSLNSENIIEDYLTEELLSWLNLRSGLEKKITALDKRTVDKATLLPIYNNIKTNSVYIKTYSLSKWLIILLAILLIAERIIAYLRKQ